MDGVVELLLVFAGRRQHLLEVIEPALAAGRHVLCDRFTDSTFAYQGAGRGVSRETIERVDRLATGGRRPDRTLLFDLPAELARQRGHSGSRRRAGEIDRLDAEELSPSTSACARAISSSRGASPGASGSSTPRRRAR